MADKDTEVKRLTPMDIHNKEFQKRGRNGYDRFEVNSFLDQVIESYGNTLDQMVDQKNEIVRLTHKVENLDNKVKTYEANKAELANAKETAKKIVDDAREKADEVTNSARIDTKFEEQQKDVLTYDYNRLKKEIDEFRNTIAMMLQNQIADLNSEKWQQALDKYFHTERFYPQDGSEPVPAADDDMDDEDIDDDLEAPDGTDNGPQPLQGDSSNNQVVNVTTESGNDSGTTFVFPDDYKNHN